MTSENLSSIPSGFLTYLNKAKETLALVGGLITAILAIRDRAVDANDRAFILATGAALSWLFLIYVIAARKKVPSLIEPGTFRWELKHTTPLARRISICGLVAVPLAAVITVWAYQCNSDPQLVTILVTQFGGNEATKDDVTARVRRAIEQLQSNPQNQIKNVSVSNASPGSKEEAESLAKKHCADVVVWGDAFLDGEVGTYLMLTRPMAAVINSGGGPSPMHVVPREVNVKSAVADSRLFAMLVRGLARYPDAVRVQAEGEGAYNGAIHAFNEALQASQDSTNDVKDYVLLYRGLCYLESGVYEKADADFKEILNRPDRPKYDSRLMALAGIAEAASLLKVKQPLRAMEQLGSIAFDPAEKDLISIVHYNRAFAQYTLGSAAAPGPEQVSALENAASEYSKALEYWAEKKDWVRAATASNGLGATTYLLALIALTEERQGDVNRWLSEADKHFSNALEWVDWGDAGNLAINVNRANVIALAGKAAGQKDKIEASLDIYREARDFYGKDKNTFRKEYAEALYAIGYYELELGYLIEAGQKRRHFEESVAFLTAARSIFCDEAAPNQRRCRTITEKDIPRAQSALSKAADLN